MSIRLKLTLYWASVLVTIVVMAAVSIFVIFRRQQWVALDAALMEEADTSAAAIARLDEPAASSVARRLSEERDIGPGKRVRLIVDGRVVADFGTQHADVPVRHNRAPGIVDGQKHIYRFAIMPLLYGGQHAILEDGVDAGQVRSSIARLQTALLIVTPLLLLVSVAGGYWLAGRSLAPVVLLADELARIEPKDLSRRLEPGSAQDEVARLTWSINALLQRLETASLTERRFVSDAAHELRTPLTVLRTGLEIALNRERDAREQREALRSALREAVELCAMADELLTLARLSEEAFVQRTTVDLRMLVNEIVEAVEPLTQAKELTVTVNCDDLVGDDFVIVDGNRDHLKRLVVNLLDNAVKFTPKKGRVTIALAKQGNRAIMRVTDSGPGIAAADLPLIFERFFRGTGARAAGSGLGLSLCKEIVRLHGGEISARNIDCGGCEVTVALPSRVVTQLS